MRPFYPAKGLEVPPSGYFGHLSLISCSNVSHKLHYFRIDEESSEEYEIDADEVWADVSNNFAAGTLSHDLIPVCQRILEEDGWKEEDFSSLYFSALYILGDDYEADFEGCETPSEALELLPETHDDWLAVILEDWEEEQPFVNYGLSKCVSVPGSFYPYLWEKSNPSRFICQYDPKKLRQSIEYKLTRVKKTKRGIYNKTKAYLDLQNAIHDLIAIAPARKNNEKEIKTLAKCKRLYPKLMSKILGEVLEILQNRPSLDREEKYMAEISEFMNEIDQAEESSEEYEIDADEVWADVSNNFAAGILSHDLIPACKRILEKDGWKEESFDSLYWSALFILGDDCQTNVEGSLTPSEALELLPETHDDWLAEILKEWELEQPFVNYGLSKCVSVPGSFYPDLYKKSDQSRFICQYDPKKLRQSIKYKLTRVKKTKRGIYNKTKAYLDVQNAIHDLIAIAPARKNNEKEIKTLAKCKHLYPNLMPKIFREVLKILRNTPGLDEEESYLAEISEFMNKIDQAMDEIVESSD
ncbi:MAG: hypothetical protein VKK42_04590 [Lyngbya sp.]|nr:hypothetical protein [Lyngbya sp.]